MASVKKTKNFKTVKTEKNKILDKSADTHHILADSSEEDDVDLKNKFKRKLKKSKKSKIKSSSISSKDLYEKSCYSEPVYLTRIIQNNENNFKCQSYMINQSDFRNDVDESEDHSQSFEALKIEANIKNFKGLQKKASNTLTEVTKLSDNGIELNETNDSSLQHRNSSASSLNSEFKSELTFNSISDSDDSFLISTKLKKVRFKKVQFNLNKSNTYY